MPVAIRPKSWWSGRTAQMGVVLGVFFLVASAVQFWTGDPLPYRLGELAPMDLRAPVDFSIENKVETEQRREAARLASPPVLLADNDYLNSLEIQLTNLKSNIGRARTIADVPEIVARFPGLTDESLAWMHSPAAELYELMVRTFMNREMHASLPLITPGDMTLLAEKVPTALGEVRLAKTTSLEDLSSTSMQHVHEVEPGSRGDAGGGVESNAREDVHQAVAQAFPQVLVQPVTGFIMSQKKPTFFYSPKLTAALADRAASLVKPSGKQVFANSIMVHRGELITWDKYQQLREAQENLAHSLARENPMIAWLSHLGRLLVVLILTVAGTLYIARLTHVRMTAGWAWSLCGLLLAMLIVAKVAVWALPQTLYLMGLAPTLLTAIILVIAFNQRFALGVSSIHALLVTLSLGQNIDFFLTTLAGVMVFSFGLGEIRTRGKLIEVGFAATVVIYVTVWALGLAHMVGQVWTPWIGMTDLRFVGAQSLWATCSGIAVAMFALAILPSVERIFKITTAMTLLELCDANKPLLRRLSQEAPGTFNHSLTVGIMAEAAGNAVGANGLLCRVGAYYHDVGKLGKPQYFIENQMAGHPNRHDKLSPAMSLLIIVGHVKDGIELAREYSLPWVVHEFIAQHHGTTLVEYFYHAARKRAEESGGAEDGRVVSDTEFRYPGPRPQTRETAIVMICDSCESLVRSIEEPTPGRIEAAVHTMIMKRLMDGQFSECDLTLRELSVIEETLVRTLVGIHHGRVAYPGNRNQEPLADVGISQPA
jgi:cyclic-di-AMP phosphodiesterase PgpH